MTPIFTTDQITDLESLNLTVLTNGYLEASVAVPNEPIHRVIRKGSVFTVEVDCCSFDHPTLQAVMDAFYADHLISMTRD